MHPATRLGGFMLFAVLLPQWPLKGLALLGLVLTACLFFSGGLGAYLRLLVRSKFVFLGLALAHALSGLSDAHGLLRAVSYLLVLLAALQALLLALPRAQLLAGLLALLRPLGALGVGVECLSVRLALTLEFATALRGTDWRTLCAEVMNGDPGAPYGFQPLILPRYSWCVRDAVALAALAALLCAGAILFAQ